MDIIFYNMSPYYDWESGIVNRNRMVFDTIKKNRLEYGVNKIIAVDLLPFSFKKAVKHYFRGHIYRRNFNTITKAPLYRLDKLDKSTYRFIGITDLALPHLLDHFDIKQDNLCIIAYDPMTINYLSRFQEAKIVFETVDNWMANPIFYEKVDSLRENYQKINKRADVIFTVAESLLALYPKHKNRHWIANGVDCDFFDSVHCGESFFAGEKSLLEKPVIGYVGTIQRRVDFELIRYLLEKNSDKNFCIAGPIMKEMQDSVNSLKQSYDNIFFPGRVLYDKLPSFLKGCDVCIVPHKIDEFTKSMNPMKIFDYLAASRPVVTTPSSQLGIFEDNIKIASDYEKFNECIQELVHNDSVEEQQKRRSFIINHTWKKRVDKMIDIIKRS